MRRVYLDNAATSWPKPEPVYLAVDQFLRNIGAAAGRGSSAESMEADALVDETRRLIARLLGVDESRQIVFTLNGTDALNLALHGFVQDSDHVITSVVEHNSVLRPLRELELTRHVQATRVGCNGDGYIDPEEIRQAIRPATSLIVLSQVSNVTGAVQPLREVGRIASEYQIPLLVDAAQSLGHWTEPSLVTSATMIASPGHKGLYGPLGTGFLYVAPELVERLGTVRQGGTGTESESDRQPSHLPAKYESGNLNLPGISGLMAGLQVVNAQGIPAICERQRRWVHSVWDGLAEIPGVRRYGPSADGKRVGVISFTITGYDPQEVAAILETSYRIQVRAGLHCAPLMHGALGTLATGGTVRLSYGLTTAEESAEMAVAAIKEIAAGAI